MCPCWMKLTEASPVLLLLRCCFFHHCCLMQISSMGCRSDRKLNAHISCEDGKPRCEYGTVCSAAETKQDKHAALHLITCVLRISLTEDLILVLTTSAGSLGPVSAAARSSSLKIIRLNQREEENHNSFSLNVVFISSSSGQGVTVCDKLQCVCDKSTAECMAAARFNQSLPAQRCHGPAPPCRRASRPPKPRLSPQSSEESEETQGGGSDVEELIQNTTIQSR